MSSVSQRVLISMIYTNINSMISMIYMAMLNMLWFEKHFVEAFVDFF